VLLKQFKKKADGGCSCLERRVATSEDNKGALVRGNDVHAHVLGCCSTLEGSRAWVTNCCSGSSPPTPLFSSAFRLHRHFTAALVVSGPSKIWLVAGAAEGEVVA
jgi:hypothetical protein